MIAKDINILAIGRNEEILKVLDRLINQTWRGICLMNDEEAVSAAQKEHFDIILFSGGISADEKAGLKDKISATNPSLIFIQHMGGGSGLLENEIRSALDDRNKDQQ